MKNTLYFLLLTNLLPHTSQAWDGRGHDTICESAVFLVQEPGLKEFLKSRPQVMGHLCNIPDIQWRNIDPKLMAAGNPTHYIDPEVVGKVPKTLPLDLKKLTQEFTGQPNQAEPGKKIFSLAREMGSAWWRVDQFMRHMGDLKETFEKSPAPVNKSEEQNENLEYNKAVYKFMTYAGVMGHYVGDLAQPFHNTANYDGWANGHGGIHGYYEGAVVAEFDGHLQTDVLKEAAKIKKADWLLPKANTLEKMQAYSQVAFDEVPKVLALDPILKKSEIKEDKGMSIKTPAERKAPSEAAKKMKPLIVKQMARAAKLLATLWDEAYVSAGKPDLTKYKSYKYPLTVDFVAPDYE